MSELPATDDISVPCVHRRYHVFQIEAEDWDNPTGLVCQDCPKTWRVVETIINQ